MQETRLLALIVLLSLAPAAQAYLDPSTGSLILSAIVGLIATIGLAVKTWWYRIKSLFRRNSASTEGDTTQSLRD
ncbi:MAG: hypothetical protein WD793_07090 [Steroidobacteraceae bacterium]